MVSGLDVAAVLPPGHHTDSGNLVALLVETRRRFAGAPRKTPPPVVWLGRCFHGFAAIGLTSAMLYQHYIPVPSECLPVAEECQSICDKLSVVLGERLSDKYALDEGTTERAYGDPMMVSAGPDLPGCVEQMLRLALGTREICQRLAADTTVLPDQRRAAAHAVATANFIRMQYGAG